MQKRKGKKRIKEIAVSEIRRMFRLAGEVFKDNPKRADRYVQIALKISTKIKVSIPGIYKRRYCKKCKKFLMPGKNCRVRTREKMLVNTCLNCGEIRRFKLKKS